ncbi:MAG: hypothetical protein AAF236_00305 [Verrucomicrobiota bacterium]
MNDHIFIFLGCLVLSGLVSCSGPKLEEFAGTWESDSMSELYSGVGLDEQLADLRLGIHPDIAKLEPAELEKLIALPDEEAKEKLKGSSLFTQKADLFARADVRVGFTIAPPDKLISYLLIGDLKQEGEFEVEYEISGEEIICRYDDGPTVFAITDAGLVSENQNAGYPKTLLFRRVGTD